MLAAKFSTHEECIHASRLSFFLLLETKFFVAAGISISNAQFRFMDDLGAAFPSVEGPVVCLVFPGRPDAVSPWDLGWNSRLYRDASGGLEAILAVLLLGVIVKLG